MNVFSLKKDVVLKAFDRESYVPKDISKLGDLITFSINSRQLAKDYIFIAIKGAHKDGHDYIDEALKNGALFVIADKKFCNNTTSNIIEVDDSMNFLLRLAQSHLEQFDVKKIAISGSNGKTTTKEMIRSLLFEFFDPENIFASEKNFNNNFGVSLNAFKVNKNHRVAVFELGMNHSNELRELCETIKPDIGVLTNISHAHEGNFENGIEGVADAKGELFEYASKKACAVVNLDDERVVKQAAKHNLRTKVTFGESTDAEVKFIKTTPYDFINGFQTIEIYLKKAKTVTLKIEKMGVHNAKNALCALASVYALDLSFKKNHFIIKNCNNNGRMSFFKNKDDILILNDAYNANPESMLAGIKASLEIKAKRKIAIIGAMGELGKSAGKHHYQLGKYLSEYFNILIICGSNARMVINGAVESGHAKNNILYFENAEAIINPLKDIVEKGDLVFIKGSNSENLQIIASALS